MVVVGGDRQDFYVKSDGSKEWHVESRDHAEEMLCGAWIRVDLGEVRTTKPRRMCDRCDELLERRIQDE